MPLPASSEKAARQIEAELHRLDQAVIDHITDGDPLPTVAAIMTRLRPLISAAVSAAIREVEPSPTTRTLVAARAPVETALRGQVTETLRAARRQRRRVPRTNRGERRTGETNQDLIKRVGAGAALLILLKARPRRRRNAEVARRVMSEVGVNAPRRTAAWAKMVVRTEAARARNVVAADRAEREGLVIRVEDGRNGPTDDACERVNGKYATVDWLRKHPLEHPNCTRKGTPAELPEGKRVTLLE